MKVDQRDKINLGEANIPKLFTGIFVPTLLGLLFNAAFNITDGIFIGHGVGSSGLAAVNLAAPIFMAGTGIGLMFGIGASVVGAIHLSQNNPKAANINITQAFIMSTGVLVLLSLLLLAFADPVLRLFGSTENLLPLAREYYVWVMPSVALIAIQIIGLFVIRLDGSPRYAMLTDAIPATLNIVLDYVFIFPLHMGLRGAAMATVASSLVGVLMVVVYMVRLSGTIKWYRLKHTMTSILLTLRNTLCMCRIGLSGLLNESAIALMVMVGNQIFVRLLGEDGVAAYSVVCYLFPLIYTISNSVAQSAQPIISYNYGARKEERVRQAFRFSMGVALVCAFVLSMVLVGSSGTLVGLFIQHGEHAYELASHGLPLFASGILFLAFNVNVIGYYQSIRYERVANRLTVMRGFVLMVISFVVLPLIAGVNGLWLAVPAAEFVTALMCLISLFVTRRGRHSQYVAMSEVHP
ncbi:MAG: MATE family efflux transporter [Paludibacteraceae bacterium]|nr:MATE family efflux transporter [Paludibacteraceae bacterium]